jgi:choline dehydrogenase-like flavoprotein
VHYFDGGKREHFQKARAVVLSANGAETARLLLNSASNRFPQGLANSSGMVGKHLMFNQGAGVHAVFEHEINDYKSVQVTRILHDFYDADPKRGFYGGGGIDARINPQPALWAMASGGDLPRWGAGLKSRLEAFPRSTMSTGHSTSLPLEANCESRSHRKGRVGNSCHSGDLQGPSGRFGDGKVFAGSVFRDHAGGRRAKNLA